MSEALYEGAYKEVKLRESELNRQLDQSHKREADLIRKNENLDALVRGLERTLTEETQRQRAIRHTVEQERDRLREALDDD
jgi:CTP-dependent riboflavin kinase